MIEENVFIALGSNMGDRRSNLDRGLEAVGRLQGTSVLLASSYIWTPPWGVRDQPWFLNAAAQLATSLAPRELLDALLSIESGAGRVRNVRNGPRTLDLDILLYGCMIVDEPGLVIPHPRMGERHFVLAPLAQIAPEFAHPVLGLTMSRLLRDLGPQPAGPAVEEVLVGGP